MAQPWIEHQIPATASDSEIEALLEKRYDEMLRRFPLKPPQHNLDKLTVYEILGESAETKELLKRLQQIPELVDALQNPAGEYTIWAPTDQAFLQQADNVEITSEETWKAILQHHISPYALFMRRLLQMGNMPTLLQPSQLNGEQRLRLRPTIAGMQASFDAYITQSDIIASNGVIHIVDALLLPPMSLMQQVALLSPSEFSLVQRALNATGLAAEVNKTTGGTLFLPTNAAFERLGAEANKFLFETDEGEQYIRAILQFHFVPSQTLYSNAWYRLNPQVSHPTPPPEKPTATGINNTTGASSKANRLDRLQKGTKTFTLPTSLTGHGLEVKISRYGSMISMFANKRTPVTTQDQIASNGVMHIISGVLLPVEEMAAENVDVSVLKSII